MTLIGRIGSFARGKKKREQEQNPRRSERKGGKQKSLACKAVRALSQHSRGVGIATGINKSQVQRSGFLRPTFALIKTRERYPDARNDNAL
jgi:hypothetical protein